MGAGVGHSICTTGMQPISNGASVAARCFVEPYSRAPLVKGRASLERGRDQSEQVAAAWGERGERLLKSSDAWSGES